MPLYTYKSKVPTLACAHCRDTFSVFQRMSDSSLTECPECGRGVYVQIRVKAAIKIPHHLKGDCRDYRDDLARYPGDPRAWVDGPRALRRLVDQTKREGAIVTKGFDTKRPEIRSSEDVMNEAYQRAKAKGFKPDAA